jgi:hypothetical protein
MKKTEQRKRGGRRHPGGGESASVEIEIERLRRRFEVFRRDHAPGTRIPEVLRAAVLAALDRGASDGALRRVCQASSVQLKLWRAQLRQAAEVGAPAAPAARPRFRGRRWSGEAREHAEP